MKIEFIESKYLGSYDISGLSSLSLEGIVYLGASVQFLDALSIVREKLESLGCKVILLQGDHSSISGQILGCDIPALSGTVIVIGTGDFHGLAGVLNNSKSYVLNPISGKVRLLKSTRVIKGRYLKFLTAKNVAIVISTKSGQYYYKRVDSLMKKFPDKNYYKIFMESVDTLEDFNYIDFIVNTACPRIVDDTDKFLKPLLNIDEILDFEK